MFARKFGFFASIAIFAIFVAIIMQASIVEGYLRYANNNPRSSKTLFKRFHPGLIYGQDAYGGGVLSDDFQDVNNEEIEYWLIIPMAYVM